MSLDVCSLLLHGAAVVSELTRVQLVEHGEVLGLHGEWDEDEEEHITLLPYVEIPRRPTHKSHRDAESGRNECEHDQQARRS